MKLTYIQKLTLFSTIIFALTFSSCTISQEYKFNDDFSGRSETKIDMSGLINVMKAMDTTGEGGDLDTISESFAEIEDILKREGAKNINLGWNDEKTVIILEYGFDNIEILNKLINEADPMELLFSEKKDESKKTKGNQFILKNNNKLIFKAPEIGNDTIFTGEDMASMKEYYKYDLTFSFNKKIKKINNKNAILGEDKRSLSFNGNIFDMFADPKKTSFKVSLEK